MAEKNSSLTGYDLSEITRNEIIEHKVDWRYANSYYLGGFYLIEHTVSGKKYVGKSRYLFRRLKDHLHNANRGISIDIDLAMCGQVEEFKFFKILDYEAVGINFFTRKLETIIEHRLIKFFNTMHPYGYNIKFYDRL